MSIETYSFSSPLLSYSCPSQTPPSSDWKSLDLAPEISAHAGETNSGNTKIEVKGTEGVECEVVFEGWKGSEGWINGWTNPNSSTWCCSLDESKDWTCFGDSGKEDFDSTTLCVYSGLDPEQEHSIKVKNSPEGNSRLLIDSAYSNGRNQPEVKPTDINTRLSASEPGTVDLKTYYSTSSAIPPSSSSTSPSQSSTLSSSPSSSLEESSTSPSPSPSASSIPGASSSSTGLFLVVAIGILAIVVVCIIAILCLRTKPKQGRESSGLSSLRSRKARKRVKERVEKVLDQGSSSEEDVEKGSTKKKLKRKKKGKYRDDDQDQDRDESSTGGSEDEKPNGRRWSKRRDEDEDTLIGEKSTDEEAGTSDGEMRQRTRRRDSHHDRHGH